MWTGVKDVSRTDPDHMSTLRASSQMLLWALDSIRADAGVYTPRLEGHNAAKFRGTHYFLSFNLVLMLVVDVDIPWYSMLCLKTITAFILFMIQNSADGKALCISWHTDHWNTTECLFISLILKSSDSSHSNSFLWPNNQEFRINIRLCFLNRTTSVVLVTSPIARCWHIVNF